MEPINQKERTNAFAQFMILYVLSIIFVIVIVFFDQQFFNKHYKDLILENKKLKESSEMPAGIYLEIDSLRNVVINWKGLSSSDYSNKRDKLMEDLRAEWKPKIDPKDMTDLDRLKASLFDTFKEWGYDKGSVLDASQVNLRIKELETEITQLKRDNKDLEKEYDSYKISHP